MCILPLPRKKKSLPHSSHHDLLTFMWVLGISTPVFMLMWQEFYPLSHLPANTVSFKENTASLVQCWIYFLLLFFLAHHNICQWKFSRQDWHGTGQYLRNNTRWNRNSVEPCFIFKAEPASATPAINWMKVISICWGKKCIWFSIPTDVTSEALGTRLVRPGGCYLVLPILEITGRKSQAGIRCPTLHLKGRIIKLL